MSQLRNKNFFITAFAMLALLSTTSCSQNPVSKLPQYLGLSHAAVIAQLGTPVRNDLFTMKDATDEFRIELQNTYPLSNPANTAIQIQELWWDDDTHWITLWLHKVNGKWVVLDSCRWDKSLEF